ncbi:MAG: multinuclear nonheme iron-dependent oxidase, partial [Burkholderiales bacterium]
AYAHCGVQPTLLERDFNIPPLPQLLLEIGQLRTIQQNCKQVNPCHG